MISSKNPRDRTQCYKTLQNNHCEMVLVFEQNVLSTNDYLWAVHPKIVISSFSCCSKPIFSSIKPKKKLNKVWTALLFFSMQQWWFTLWKTHDMSNLNYFCYACTWCFLSYLKPDNMVVRLEQRKKKIPNPLSLQYMHCSFIWFEALSLNKNIISIYNYTLHYQQRKALYRRIFFL